MTPPQSARGSAHAPRLSCCIITLNEAERIERCIRAVEGIVDEVVVVDSGSTDDTVAKARALGASVYRRDFDGYGPQKRFAEDCAVHDWILHLDADEVVSSALRMEIAALMAQGPRLRAYRMRILTVYPGRRKPRLWADFHNYVRLYDRRAVRFSSSPVHDTVYAGKERVGQLKGGVLHFSMRDYDHMRRKLAGYATLQAKVLKKPVWLLRARLATEYPFYFFKYYVMRRHFTGGYDGLLVSHIGAANRVARLRKMLEHTRAARALAEIAEAVGAGRGHAA